MSKEHIQGDTWIEYIRGVTDELPIVPPTAERVFSPHLAELVK